MYLYICVCVCVCVSVKLHLRLGFNVFTSKVKLRPVSTDCARALVVMRPWRAVFTELKKLDFPAPCGPCRRILSVSTSVFPDLKLVIVVIMFCLSFLEGRKHILFGLQMYVLRITLTLNNIEYMNTENNIVILETER